MPRLDKRLTEIFQHADSFGRMKTLAKVVFYSIRHLTLGWLGEKCQADLSLLFCPSQEKGEEQSTQDDSQTRNSNAQISQFKTVWTLTAKFIDRYYADLKYCLLAILLRCATLALAQLLAFLFGFKDVALIVSVIILYAFPLIGAAKFLKRWSRARYPSISQDQWRQFHWDMFIAFVVFDVTLFFDYLISAADNTLLIVASFVGISFGAYLFSMLCARAMVNFGKGFKTA